jgi:hypothetical protein
MSEFRRCIIVTSKTHMDYVHFFILFFLFKIQVSQPQLSFGLDVMLCRYICDEFTFLFIV